MRSTVLLPQPEGPRRERNSPGAASSDTSSTATTAPNDLRSRRDPSAGAAPLTAGDAPPRGGAQRAISRPQRSDHSGNFRATKSVSGKYMRWTISP